MHKNQPLVVHPATVATIPLTGKIVLTLSKYIPLSYNA
jgi:hypothetical protein